MNAEGQERNDSKILRVFKFMRQLQENQREI